MYFKIVTYFFNHTQFIAIARLGHKQRALALCFLTDLQHVHFHQWRTKYGSPRAFFRSWPDNKLANDPLRNQAKSGPEINNH